MSDKQPEHSEHSEQPEKPEKPEKPEPQEFHVDRRTTCPFVLPVLLRVGEPAYRRLGDAAAAAPSEPHKESPRTSFDIYAWPDSTLREIAACLMRECPAARQRNARIRFAVRRQRTRTSLPNWKALPAPESRPTRLLRMGYVRAFGRTPTDERTLAWLGYRPGEQLLVSVEPWDVQHEVVARKHMRGRVAPMQKRVVPQWWLIH